MAPLSFTKQVVVNLGRQHRHALLLVTLAFFGWCSLSTKIVDRIQIILPINLFVKRKVTIFLHFNVNFKSGCITGPIVIVWWCKFILSDVLNEGKNCYSNCGNQQGPCSWCGREGLCCRIGSDYIGNGCDGKLGGQNRHECVLKTGWLLTFQMFIKMNDLITKKILYDIT